MTKARETTGFMWPPLMPAVQAMATTMPMPWASEMVMRAAPGSISKILAATTEPVPTKTKNIIPRSSASAARMSLRESSPMT